jgi:uncharacterized protein DUF5939
MSDTKALFDNLRNSADQNVVVAIEAVIRDGTDRQLCLCVAKTQTRTYW